MSADPVRYRPEMTRAGLVPTHEATAVDEYGNHRSVLIAGESPLTLYVDNREIVTLMTLGGHPEALTLGYLRNQGFLDDITQIKAVQVDWETESVAVVTHHGIEGWEDKLAKRTVTTGCGQGTVFGDIMDKLESIHLPQVPLSQALVYELLHNLNTYNEVYKEAGAVHGCALCRGADILMFVEDVGRHNAVDAIAGQMWLDGLTGEDKIFYTTGRLTSEMVIKVAQMGIPVLLSRSGVTQMGLSLAQRVGVTMLARVKGTHFLIYHGTDSFVFDAPPQPRSARLNGRV